MSIEAIANAALGVMALAAFVFWIYSLVNWDGSCPCDKSQCESCPFPCEEHQKRRRNKDQ